MTQSPPAPQAADPTPTPNAFVQEAFTHIRAKDFAAARAVVDRGLGRYPDDPFVAHAAAHLYTDSGAHQEGADYLRAFLTSHDPFDRISVHTTWHLADLELQLGHGEAALDWHRRVVAPSVGPMTFYSAVTLLWRLVARGHADSASLRPDWDVLRTAALTMEPDPLKDVAAAMTFIATGDAAGLAAVRERLAGSAADSKEATIAVPLVDALSAFHQRDYTRTIALLEPLPLDELTPYAEQLTVYEDTLAAARATR
ncbi:MAG TPA: hypothetical protein VFX49_17360 [Chloroflexota bacterium]|nr:hypothetical protein [Chloroflexota bacterium]